VVINPGDFHTNNSQQKSFLAPTGDSDPYNEIFKNALIQIEKDEAAGWKPEVLAASL